MAAEGARGHQERIGFMQGRFSPVVDGRIQCFPWDSWEDEFRWAHQDGWLAMEWTLDHERIYENPLLTPEGREAIRGQVAATGVQVRSLTADFFMQAPYYKAEGAQREARLADLEAVIQACGAVGIRALVPPLVDYGRLGNAADEAAFREGVDRMAAAARRASVQLNIEIDLPPEELARFIETLPEDVFGVNYDIGNSASLGYDYHEELAAYLPRIRGVHVKDRVRDGGTVPLGSGDADLPGVVAALEAGGYQGRYILQTARAADGDHAGALRRYRDLVVDWLGG